MSEKKVRLDELEPADINGEKTRVVDLYTKGCTLAYIAQVIGRSPAYVSKLLHAAYQEDKADRDMRILAHSQTIQWLMKKTIDRIDKSGDKWSRQDGEFYLKLREQEAKLKGLDQPTKVEAKVEIEQFSDDELVAQLNQVGIQVSLPPAKPPLALSEPVEDAHFEVNRDSPTDQPVTQGGAGEGAPGSG